MTSSHSPGQWLLPRCGQRPASRTLHCGRRGRLRLECTDSCNISAGAWICSGSMECASIEHQCVLRIDRRLSQHGDGDAPAAGPASAGKPRSRDRGERVPEGVICLVSALCFHELMTQVPHEVDVAIERGRKKPPRIDYPPVRVFKFSGAAFRQGIEVHKRTAFQFASTAPRRRSRTPSSFVTNSA